MKKKIYKTIANEVKSRLEGGSMMAELQKEFPYKTAKDKQRFSEATGNPCIIEFKDGSRLDLEGFYQSHKKTRRE